MKGFPRDARVCFIGDSITHDNDFVSHISAYYHEHLKDRKVNFYNCGVAGGRMGPALEIIEKDVFSHNPTHAVIMMGINDSDRMALLEDRSYERYDRLKKAYDIFEQNLRQMCTIIRERNIKAILCTQTPYDEYQNTDTEVLNGGWALMAGYAQCVRDVAREMNLPLCDYHTYFSKVLQKEVLFMPDRVHPNDLGQFHMAKCFLAFQGYDLGEKKPFPKYMNLWREKVEMLRNIWAAERIITNRFDLSQEEQISKIKAYVEDPENIEIRSHIVGRGRQYLETYHMRDQLNEEINYIMEVEFKKGQI